MKFIRKKSKKVYIAYSGFMLYNEMTYENILPTKAGLGGYDDKNIRR